MTSGSSLLVPKCDTFLFHPIGHYLVDCQMSNFPLVHSAAIINITLKTRESIILLCTHPSFLTKFPLAPGSTLTFYPAQTDTHTYPIKEHST